MKKTKPRSIEIRTKAEKVLLVGVTRSSAERWTSINSLEELANLTKTAGGEVIESFLQIRPRFEPATLIGIGKVHELSQIAQKFNIDLIIFNHELSGAQIRNITNIINKRIIDRTTLILDIFAKHARTREAIHQVELAQLQYRLSKLIGSGTALSRLGGGIGTRGPGEKQLEVDRRRINERIATLKRALKKIESTKRVQRTGRRDLPKIAVVGYTNAGKSSLVNSLTRARLLTSDQLFSTLDSNTSLLFVPPNHRMLISDTVGFLKDLPHSLIASFRATLAEVLEADLLLQIVDATCEDVESRLATIENVLNEINARDKPSLIVFNKIDRLFPENKIRLAERYPKAFFVSAKERTGIEELKLTLRKNFFSRT
ncbi:GTPase HflX [candidate division WOR-3 bacterium RBG_13_43_14]|uniref:GTPase HflX n=1 Tax=candidate division WOR-3 bacterium RBG_13_43_14 TaxID=1802590 RepID=A0A1F4U3D6_UNCW3|nr:MAG: GTPase HflX [candidate division WOR-3 bacterium RBG_13_43_14]